MKQVYITAVPLQGKNGLMEYVYSSDCINWEENPKTHFPIISVISNTMESRKNTEIIALRSRGDWALDNYEVLVNELKEYGVDESQIKIVEIGDFSNRKEMMSMLLRIMDAIPDNALIYTDITYQTKPVSATLINAMNMVESFKTGLVQVEGIYYGEAHRDASQAPIDSAGNRREASIYDITAMKTFADLTYQLKAVGVEDVRGLIVKMMTEE